MKKESPKPEKIDPLDRQHFMTDFELEAREGLESTFCSSKNYSYESQNSLPFVSSSSSIRGESPTMKEKHKLAVKKRASYYMDYRQDMRRTFPIKKGKEIKRFLTTLFQEDRLKFLKDARDTVFMISHIDEKEKYAVNVQTDQDAFHDIAKFKRSFEDLKYYERVNGNNPTKTITFVLIHNMPESFRKYKSLIKLQSAILLKMQRGERSPRDVVKLVKTEKILRVLQKYEDDMIFLILTGGSVDQNSAETVLQEILNNKSETTSVEDEMELKIEKKLKINYLRAVLFAVLMIVFLFFFFHEMNSSNL